MKTTLLLNDGDNFDFAILDCFNRALSTLGESVKEFVEHELEHEFHLSGKNFAKEPLQFEESLREILGDFVSASILMHTIENISESFRLSCNGCSSLTKMIEYAKKAKS